MHVADPVDFQDARGCRTRRRGRRPWYGSRRPRQRRRRREHRPAATQAPAAAPGGGRGGDAAPVVQRSPANGGWSTEQMKAKYGEITMLDFPQFTKDTFPGVTHMDLFSGLFGDVTDDSMFAGPHVRSLDAVGPQVARSAGREMAKTGVKCQHISNNAPTNLAGPGRGGTQGGGRDRQEMARGMRRARREVDADELDVGAGPGHPPERHSRAVPATAIPATSTSSRC